MDDNMLIHPQPSIYESTVVLVDGRVVTHQTVEEAASRPKWDQADAEARLREP